VVLITGMWSVLHRSLCQRKHEIILDKRGKSMAAVLEISMLCNRILDLSIFTELLFKKCDDMAVE